MENQNIDSLQNDTKDLASEDANDVIANLASNIQDQVEAERKALLSSVSSSSVRTTKEKVAFILNRSLEARNSDIDLAWEYWHTFESNKFNGFISSKEQLRSLTGLASLCRARAKIQNEYELYLADEPVRKFRGTLKDEIKKEAVEDKPGDVGLYSVYIDETGKNENYISVGSLWLLDAGSSVYFGQQELVDWRKSRGIEFEFHFSQLSKNRLQAYQDFFTLFLQKFSTIGFKTIVLNNKGFKDTRPVITDLTYHLISKGIIHEDESKRAPLPRRLQVWIDEEEKGSDKLKLENIRERLTGQKINGLFLDNFTAIESKNNFFIQMADLFTGAINRKINFESTGSVKDEFADFVLNKIGFDIGEIDKENSQTDNATVFNLR